MITSDYAVTTLRSPLNIIRPESRIEIEAITNLVPFIISVLRAGETVDRAAFGAVIGQLSVIFYHQSLLEARSRTLAVMVSVIDLIGKLCKARQHKHGGSASAKRRMLGCG